MGDPRRVQLCERRGHHSARVTSVVPATDSNNSLRLTVFGARAATARTLALRGSHHAQQSRWYERGHEALSDGAGELIEAWNSGGGAHVAVMAARVALSMRV